MGERNNDFSFLNGLFGTPEPTTPKPHNYLADFAAAYKPQDTPLSILAGLTLSGSMFAPTPKPSGIYFDRFGADSVPFSEPCKFPWYFTPLPMPALYAILVANPFSPNGFRVVYFGQTGDASRDQQGESNWQRLRRRAGSCGRSGDHNCASLVVTRSADLTLGANHTDPYRLALAFWILQPRVLRLFLLLGGVDSGVSSPSMYLKSSHRSTILGMRNV